MIIRNNINKLIVSIKSSFIKNNYIEEWKELKEKYKGERIFLIGNGPSLNKTPLYLLKDEYTLAFNRFNIYTERLNWYPSMYMVVDGLVAEDMSDEINEMTKKVDNAFFLRYALSTGLDFKKFINDGDNVYWMLPKGLKSKFNFQLPFVNPGGSVAVAGLQVLQYLGFSEIYLLGIDMNYQTHNNVDIIKGNDIISKEDDDPNHFDPRYFGKNRKYHQPNTKVVNSIMTSFESISYEFKNTETKVYNATKGGRLESFERADLKAVLKIDAKEEFELFRKLFKEKTGLDLNEEKTSLIKDISYIQGSEDLFIVESDISDQVISKFIYTHLPLGPCDDKMYFLNRKLLLK
jgi:hypothetical protein